MYPVNGVRFFGFIPPLFFAALSYANYQYFRNIPLYEEYQLFAIAGPWAWTFAWFILSRLYKPAAWLRWLFYFSTWPLFFAVVGAWGVLGLNLYFIVTNQ